MLVFLILAIANLVKTDHICDIELLKIELQEDIDDNGILDCLRVIAPSSIKEENDREINARLSAQWDSDCSFETTNTNLNKVKEAYKIQYYYDSLGNQQDTDDDDQADICELIRAAYGEGKFGYYKDLKKVDKNFLAFLDCPGKGEITQPCAYNESKFWEQGLWTIVYQPVGIKIKNQKYVEGKSEQPKYLPAFKLQGQLTEAELKDQKEKDKENIKKLKVFQSEQTNMVKAINSQQNLDYQQSTLLIVKSDKFQSLGSAYNLKLSFLDEYNFFIFTSITANFDEKSKDDTYLMCRNEIIRQKLEFDSEQKINIKTPIVKIFPFTLTDYKEGTSYFNLQSFSRKYIKNQEASFDVECYSNTNIKLNNVKSQIFTWGLYLDAKLAQQTKTAYLQPLKEDAKFLDFENQDLINLYIDVDKYRKNNFGDDDSQLIIDDKQNINGAKKQLLLVTYEVSGQFSGKLEVKAYSKLKDKNKLGSDYQNKVWNAPIIETQDVISTISNAFTTPEKTIDFKQSYSMKQQKLFGSVFGFGIAELDPKGIFKLGLQYRFTTLTDQSYNFPLDQRSKELDALATKDYVINQKPLKASTDKNFATISYSMILLPYLNLKIKEVQEVKPQGAEINIDIDNDHSTFGKPLIFNLDKNLNNKFTNFEFNAYHALISYHISFECDSNSPQFEFYLTQWNKITMKNDEIQGSRVVSEDPNNSPQIQTNQVNNQIVKTIRTASVLTYAKFIVQDDLNDYLDQKQKTIEINVMARLVNNNKNVQKSTITLKSKKKDDPIETQTFSRLEVNLFASIDDITKNKYDT